MKLKVLTLLKRSRSERFISHFQGIGKPVSCTPTFLGWFILKGYFSALKKDEITPISPLFLKRGLN